jgi:hypothetical protein
MLQQAGEQSAAKRSQAAFELDADFRLALSGTPVKTPKRRAVVELIGMMMLWRNQWGQTPHRSEASSRG